MDYIEISIKSLWARIHAKLKWTHKPNLNKHHGPTTQIQQIYQMLSQLVYKPSVKGSVGEKILADIWPQYFNKDIIEMLGGAGREDFLINSFFRMISYSYCPFHNF